MNHSSTLITSRRALLGLAAATALTTALPSFAQGRLMEVSITDRSTGRELPVYHHKGEYWVAGRPGARYAIGLRNQTGRRLLSVVSVDGVNVITGQSAAYEQNGYVLASGQSYDVTGWRKSDNHVAAFHFTKARKSYASRTGRPFDLGVIGAAVFRERPPIRHHHDRHRAPWFNDWFGDESGELHERQEMESRAPSAKSAPLGKSHRAEAEDRSSRLGTGHGRQEYDRIGHTRFERLHASPDEIISIRYDSYANLVARGVIPRRHRHDHSHPRPFPHAPQHGYVPDPY
ncbi:hypothetical protein [Hydrogenophaga sp. 5NK40-0174]|uniref:hypothetical protein n=1 Tax=Hydrogenophaga sp. 5NK40-0174 TaxID=3127649 RepID=UPI00310C3A19